MPTHQWLKTVYNVCGLACILGLRSHNNQVFLTTRANKRSAHTTNPPEKLKTHTSGAQYWGDPEVSGAKALPHCFVLFLHWIWISKVFFHWIWISKVIREHNMFFGFWFLVC